MTKTEVVEKKVEVYKELPPQLTEPVPYPPALSERYTEQEKTDLIFALYDALDQANKDKADAGALTKGDSE